MSYQSISNYYGTGPDPRNSHTQYPPLSDGTDRSNSYQAQMRNVDNSQQTQYGSNQYGWTGSNQTVATSDVQSSYMNGQWSEKPAPSTTTYQYQKDIYSSSDHTNTRNNAYQSRDTYNSQDASGLNHLAYASGLEPAVPTRPTGKLPQSNSPIGYTASAGVSTHQNRTSSPANVGTHYPRNGTRQSAGIQYSTQNHGYSPSNNDQNFAVNAATALAGAVRNQQSQASSQVNTRKSVTSSASPRTPNAQSTNQQVHQRNNVQAQNTSSVHYNRKSVGQLPFTANVSTSPATPHAVPSRQSNATDLQTNTQLSRPEPSPARQVEHQVTVRQQTPIANPTAPNPQSIANLVTSTDESDQNGYGNTTGPEDMPHFIDPSQVFNPYHREHERKRREVAEAEERKRREEQRLAELRKEADAAAMAAAAAEQQAESSTSSKTKVKPAKKSQRAKSKIGNQPVEETGANTTTSVSTEESMASEMAKLMAKMKEFKNTNPALFQKLWNDMRGGGATNASIVSTQTPSPQVVQATLPVDTSKPSPQPRSRSKKSEKTFGIDLHPANGYKVMVEDNLENLPDLGRFPAERRIRQPYVKQKPTESTELLQTPQAPTGTISAATPVLGSPNIPVTVSRPNTRPVDTNATWPEPRRRAVAIAAVRFLKTNHPDNVSIPVNVQDICSILERNPSYMDLCTELETRGLKFQKTILAKELLKSVPELATSTSKAAPNTQPEDNSISAIAQSDTSSLPATVQPGHSQPVEALPVRSYQVQPSGTNVPIPSTTVSGPVPVKSEQSSTSSKPPPKAFKTRPGGVGTSNRPEPPPGSKEAAAKKRDFAELIDLSELDNNDNYVLPTKQPRIETPMPQDLMRKPETEVRTAFNTVSSEPFRFNPQPQFQSHPLPIVPVQTPMYMQPSATNTCPPSQPLQNGDGSQAYLYYSNSQRAQQISGRTRMILAQKIDKAEALQKSYYDPKTVARDILIASGRHPSERPLNVHLAGLIGTYLELDSNVSTFDWDTVDPGGPPAPKVDFVDIPAAPPRFKLGDRVRKRAKLADFGREMHDANQDAAPHPTLSKAHAQAHLHRPSSAASPQPSTTSKKGHRNADLNFKRQQNVFNVKRVGNEDIKSTPKPRNISIDIPIPSSSQRSTRSASQQVAEPRPDTTMDTPSTGKRRGRPPGAKNKYPSVAAMKQQAKAVVTELPAEQNTPEPLLHSYKCKWIRCHADLHNLDTLRRHVMKKHDPSPGEVNEDRILCWWKKCRYLEADGDGKIHPAHTFKNRKEWIDHIEADHMHPIALRYGDGPATTHTDPQSVNLARERYLSDHSGRSTTPLVSSDGNSDHPPDAMVLTRAYPQGPKTDKEKADAAAQGAFMKAHGNKSKDTKKAAEEVVRAMAVRKAKIGPGIDRGGCTLINEARRSTFMQEPGISRVVDLEY